jgi:hypothetical protein
MHFSKVVIFCLIDLPRSNKRVMEELTNRQELRVCSVLERRGMEWNGSVLEEWNGFIPAFGLDKKEERNGTVFLFGWRNWRAERNVVKLNFCLKIVINNGK